MMILYWQNEFKKRFGHLPGLFVFATSKEFKQSGPAGRGKLEYEFKCKFLPFYAN